MKEIKLKEIKSRVFDRSYVDEKKMKKLVRSVKNIGIAQPILVRPTKEGYELVIGGRRVEASKRAKSTEIPAVVRELSDREALELVLAENLHREDLSNVSKGKICKLLIDQYPEKYPSQEKLAEKIGMTQSMISQWIQLTEMPQEVQEIIAPVEKETKGPPKGKISSIVATTIGGKIKEPKRQVALARAMAKKRISFHKSRRIIERAAKESRKPVEKIIEEMRPEPELVFWEEFRKPILKGRKTVTIRPTSPKVKEGDVAWAHFTDPKAFKLKIAKVERRVLGELTDDDLKGEGVKSLKEYEKIWRRIHDQWNPKKKVYVVRFEKR